jgi:hypothetical protein
MSVVMEHLGEPRGLLLRINNGYGHLAESDVDPTGSELRFPSPSVKP